MPSRKSHIQLYADECFPVSSVTYLKSLGYSIIHAYDKKLIRKTDQIHLKMAKNLRRVLITLDRDFLYYTQVSLDKHPGVIVISPTSSTPQNVNKLCKKLLAGVSKDFIKDSLIKATNTKLIKVRKNKVMYEKKIN